MKKGYLYLVVSDEEIEEVRHYHNVGILVEGTGVRSEFDSRHYDYVDDDGIGQWMSDGHVVEIGKI